jgi:glycosyltransferase involved in cell wall biosynthesis
VHDLNHIDRPENSTLAKRTYYRTVLHHLCKRARAVLTVSDFSRQRIVDWFGLEPNKVFNVGNGVSPTFSRDGDHFVRPHGYLLCVSNRRGHKNEITLLSALSKARLPKDLELVLTGKPNVQLISHAQSLGVAHRLNFVGHVSEEKLAALYRGAEALVFPSCYEGFGLPIVEAFSCGTPVLTSNVTAMPEVAGNAALLVNPFDVEAIAAALTRLCNDSTLRSALIAQGLARAPTYSWDSVAGRVRDAIKSVDVNPMCPLSWD